MFQNVCNGLSAHVIYVEDSAEVTFIMEFTKASWDGGLLLISSALFLKFRSCARGVMGLASFIIIDEQFKKTEVVFPSSSYASLGLALFNTRLILLYSINICVCIDKRKQCMHSVLLHAFSRRNTISLNYCIIHMLFMFNLLLLPHYVHEV